MTDRQMKMVLVLFVLGVFLCGLLFVVTAERTRASAQLSRALEHEMAKYSCSTQDNGTVVYTKTEDNAEMAAELSDINEVSIDDWLTIIESLQFEMSSPVYTGRDATNAQTIYAAGQGEVYAPSNTLIISRELPTVVGTAHSNSCREGGPRWRPN